MGKSPAKWMKTLLFGKKSSKSSASRKAANGKKYAGDKESPAAVDSPVISQPLAVATDSNIKLDAERGTTSTLSSDRMIDLPTNQDVVKDGNAALEVSSDLDKIRENKAVIKLQASFRGFLARRAFRALRGIIRLQALVRGHLVRRQAVATLRCMQGIVKLQAQARGRRVRISDTGIEINKKLFNSAVIRAKLLSSTSATNLSQKTKLSANTFICKLLSGTPIVMPLKLQYINGEPNSVWSWLERWTSSLFWKPLPQPKKAVEVKSQVRHGGYTMETESGRQKRSVRKNFPPNTDNGSTNIIIEPGKAKRTFRKISSTPVELVQEHPQSELEKVKRNLRKISSSMAQSTDQVENEIERPKNGVRKVLSPAVEASENSTTVSAEKIKKNISAISPEVISEIEISMPVLGANLHVDNASEPPSKIENHAESAETAESVQEVEIDMKSAEVMEVDIDASINDNFASESQNNEDEKFHSQNGELTIKEEQACHENQKAATKRRASLSTKTECIENGSPHTPTLPSYMQATQSAKAKLRGLSSPRFSSDGIDKSGFTRRHSLPSSTNGKLASVPSQAQRLVTGGKGGIRSDRSFSSSRDGNDRPIQVEWKR